MSISTGPATCALRLACASMESTGGTAPPLVAVTGAAGAIGRSVVSELAGRGSSVLALDLDGEALAALAGEQVDVAQCDLCAETIKAKLRKMTESDLKLYAGVGAAAKFDKATLVGLVGDLMMAKRERGSPQRRPPGC